MGENTGPRGRFYNRCIHKVKEKTQDANPRNSRSQPILWTVNHFVRCDGSLIYRGSRINDDETKGR